MLSSTTSRVTRSVGGSWWEVEFAEREQKTSGVIVSERFVMGEGQELGMRGVASPRWPADGSGAVS